MVFDRNRPRAETNCLLAEIVRRQSAIRVDPSNARIHSLANTAPLLRMGSWMDRFSTGYHLDPGMKFGIPVS